VWDDRVLKNQLIIVEAEVQRQSLDGGGYATAKLLKGQDGKMDCFKGMDCKNSHCNFTHPPGFQRVRGGGDQRGNRGGDGGRGRGGGRGGPGGRGGGQRELSTIDCYNYGKHGHYARNCPDKATAKRAHADDYANEEAYSASQHAIVNAAPSRALRCGLRSSQESTCPSAALSAACTPWAPRWLSPSSQVQAPPLAPVT
jgi:hypothetical protein